ncbi:hypothetical protein [Methanosarcina horonobensis]|nr:hypothetical protein [Methanosarcina horonobensis]
MPKRTIYHHIYHIYHTLKHTKPGPDVQPKTIESSFDPGFCSLF